MDCYDSVVCYITFYNKERIDLLETNKADRICHTETRHNEYEHNLHIRMFDWCWSEQNCRQFTINDTVYVVYDVEVCAIK